VILTRKLVGDFARKLTGLSGCEEKDDERSLTSGRDRQSGTPTTGGTIRPGGSVVEALKPIPPWL